MGRLGQGKELARVGPAGDQIVTRAFRCALGQDRRLDLDKASFVQKVADELDDSVTQDHVSLHPRPAQIEVAILEPQCLCFTGLAVDVEGRCFRRVEDRCLAGCDLDLTSEHVQIPGAFWAEANGALDLEHPFVASLVGNGVRLRGGFLVEGHLDDT